MGAGEVPCCEPMFWGYMFACVVLVCFAGLMSGLTLGLMSLSLVELEVIAKAGQPQDRKNAEKILPIVKNHHLLLCTLLISNAMAMEALPIFVDSLLPAWASVLISVTLILVFGEIIPQAVCSRYGLSVGAKLSFLVRLLVLVFFPLSYPISKLLDWLLGKGHAVLLRRPELKTLVDIHGAKAGKGGELTLDETTIISGALDMTQKTAKDAMTPVSEIFSLDIESKLDEPTMGQILSKGHSRVPIYYGSPTNIIGIILAKSLIKLHPKDETPIKDLAITRIPRVHECLPLYDLLNEFQKGHSHMAAVVKEERETTEKEAKPSVIKLNTGVDSRQTHAVRKGTNQLRSQSKRQNLSAKSSSMDFSETEIQISSLKNVKLNHNLSSQPKKKRVQEGKIISLEDLESLSNLNGEVIGIITLEDVMEELLQEEILDETDEFVIHHKRIKINMSPSRISPTTWNSHMQWQTSMASPASSYEHTPSSSYNHTPIMNSPISTYGQSPPIRRPLCPSPSPSPNYPPIYAGGGR